MSEQQRAFTCAGCGLVFKSEWSDEDAAAESQAVFGMTPQSAPMDVVCDACYRQMTADWRPTTE